MNVPGVTDEEIHAITELRMNNIYFKYGMTSSTEAYRENGRIKGFSDLFCAWLTEFFGIPFRPVIYTWGELIEGLEDGSVDFTGELTATDERRGIYFMTDAIAKRQLKLFRIAGGASPEEIAMTRPPRYIFLEGATTVDLVTSNFVPGSYEIVYINDSGLVYDLLKSGKADAYFNESGEEFIFDKYEDVIAQDFFPLSYSPVSMAARKPALAPVISVMQKMLRSGGVRFLTELYNRGQKEYLSHKLAARLTEDESAYIEYNPVVSFAAEYDNYPLSFYNTREKEWQGIAFDVLGEIEKLTGLSFQVVNDQDTGRDALLKMLENRDASMISELIRTDEREGRFIWPHTPVFSDHYALLSSTNYPDINVNEILYVKTGLIQGTAYATLFKKWFPDHTNTVEYSGALEAFQALARGEVDMVMSSLYQLLVLTNYQEHPGFKANVIFDQPFNSTFGFNRDDKVLCSIVDKALHLIDTGGISGRWMRKTYDYREKLAQMQIPWLIGASSLLLCVLLLTLVLLVRNRNEGRRLERLVQRRTAEIEKQRNLKNLVNEMAVLLLESDAIDCFSPIVKCMEMICLCADVDHVHLWKNTEKDDGRLYHKQVCKGTRDSRADDGGLLEFSYQDAIPGMEEVLSRGESVNGPVGLLPEKERLHLSSLGIESVLIVPVFLNGGFWGFVSLDNSDRQRVYDDAEEDLLRSWGLLAVGAIQRSEIASDMRRTLTKLEAVISNYKGVIWSIDSDRVITTFDGQYTKSIGVEPSFIAGKNIDQARLTNGHRDIIEHIEKTFREGPQDWTSEINGGVFHSSTSLMRDHTGSAIGIVGSTDEVTEIFKLQHDLENAVESAKTASESKSRFLANMSHEMRTPLNAIIGLAELELGASTLGGTSFVNMEKIYAAGLNLLGIINDLLDISKIEAGKFALIPVAYDVPSLISDTINLNMVRLGSKPIQFRLHVDASLPARLEGDELRIKQVFNNLLSNAIKYTDAGFIDWYISCVKEGGRVKVLSTVQDTGRGIRGEDIEKLFKEDYSQFDLKANYYVEGTGLGLSITKNLIRLMDGNIKVESEYRRGSSFTVEFFQNAAGDGVIGEEAANNLSQFRYSVQRRSRNQQIIRADMSYATVLVVDDVVANLDVARGMLKPYKLNVDCATSGLEAINRIKTEKIHYDAVFMDHMMPGMDGVEAVRRIREEIGTEYAKTVPIIALTANALTGNDAIFLKNGFQAFLSKPIDILRMDQVLNHWVRDKAKEKEQQQAAGETEAPQEEPKQSGIFQSLSIPGFDAASGLERFNNDEDSYLFVLRSFAANTPDCMANIKSFSPSDGKEKMDLYRIAAHSVKGSSRGIGADLIGKMAEKLEGAAKISDFDYIENNNKIFIDAVEQFLEALNNFFKSVPKKDDSAKPEKDAPDPELMAVLKKAVEDYDMAALNKVIDDLDAFRYRSLPDFVNWLREQAGKSNFDVMQKKLESM
ncbi:MAG: transporter substrate-binding domain-containing protein [Treponema sp.]|nr:transporter substrate-binding domain-containing protein [Treponema sp.]